MMHSLPQKYIERIKKIIPQKEWDDFFANITRPLPKTIRVTNSRFEKPQNWTLKKVSELPNSFFVEREDQKESPLGKTLEHFTGQIYIQSLSSMLPVKILDPKPETKILDLCAAPGSKTTYIAQKMQNTGCLVANEPSGTRSKKLAANLDRLGVCNTVLLQSDGIALASFLGQEFDQILLDAPCSSEGFGRKDARFFEKSWQEKKIFAAAKVQKALILSAFKMLKPEGEMIYSTCTSAPEENEMVVEFLRTQFPDCVEMLPIDLGSIPHRSGLENFYEQKFSSLVSKYTKRLYPHLFDTNWDSECFFIAKIRKKKALQIPPPKKPEVPTPFQILKKNQSAMKISQLVKPFGIPKDLLQKISVDYETDFTLKSVLFEKNQDIFMTTKPVLEFCKKNLFRRAGLKVLDKNENITHEYALHFGQSATKNYVLLSDENKKRWLQGYDLSFNFLDTSFLDLEKKNALVLMRYKNFILGFGKIVGEKIKNKLDKDLVQQ